MGILKNALAEVEAAACRYTPEWFALWKENRDVLLSWIYSMEKTYSLPALTLPASREILIIENNHHLIEADGSVIAPLSGSEDTELSEDRRCLNVLRGPENEAGSLLVCPPSHTNSDLQETDLCGIRASPALGAYMSKQGELGVESLSLNIVLTRAHMRNSLFVPISRSCQSLELPSPTDRRAHTSSTSTCGFIRQEIARTINFNSPYSMDDVDFAPPNLAAPQLDVADRLPPSRHR
ncbi:hypothetical protein R1flu_019839 [Riccia fluitans]|uniref:Uncharacterized protein n=1 Tax=Riccia fluitans TaxID=41844 RepID=A0ABD1ZLZ8_9MARC